MMSPDTDTLQRAINGDSAAFGEVVDVCYDSIFRFAMKYTGQRQDAEDVAQLACIKLASSIRGFRFEAAFTTWLYRLVMSCARDWYRQQHRHLGEDSGAESFDPVMEAGGESQVYLGQILSRVAAMGEGYRDALVLVVGEGMSHAEAARLLGVKESTVSWRIHEIRRCLAREELQ